MNYTYGDSSTPDYPSDIDRIVQVFKDKGYTISNRDVEAAWLAYSGSMCDGWI